MKLREVIQKIFNWILAIVFMAIGTVNTFWGNDTFFGILILILSLAFLPPATSFIKEKTGFSIPVWVKIILALFIIWSSLGVGELYDKVDLMINDLKDLF